MKFEALHRKLQAMDEELFGLGLRQLAELQAANKAENEILIKANKMGMSTILDQARAIFMARLTLSRKETENVPEGQTDESFEAEFLKSIEFIESFFSDIRDGLDMDLDD